MDELSAERDGKGNVDLEDHAQRSCAGHLYRHIAMDDVSPRTWISSWSQVQYLVHPADVGDKTELRLVYESFGRGYYRDSELHATAVFGTDRQRPWESPPDGVRTEVVEEKACREAGRAVRRS